VPLAVRVEIHLVQAVRAVHLDQQQTVVVMVVMVEQTSMAEMLVAVAQEVGPAKAETVEETVLATILTATTVAVVAVAVAASYFQAVAMVVAVAELILKDKATAVGLVYRQAKAVRLEKEAVHLVLQHLTQ